MPTVSPAVAPPRTQTLLRVLALAVVAVFAGTFGAPAPAQAQTVRIKDIADFEGVRDNMLVGYGLSVGLNGTGDKLNRSVSTSHTLTGMLECPGVNTPQTA